MQFSVREMMGNMQQHDPRSCLGMAFAGNSSTGPNDGQNDAPACFCELLTYGLTLIPSSPYSSTIPNLRC